MTRLFYGLAALEAAVLLFFVGQYAFGPGTATSSGGAAMGVFFFALVPLAALLLATAAFRFARWRVLRFGAALMVVAPPVILGIAGLNDAVQRSEDEAAARDYASGRGYFSGPAAQALGEAIVRGDAAGVAAASRGTDVSAAGEMGQTFLGLAMTRTAIDTDVVCSLLDAGADPNHNNGWPLGVAIGRGSVPLLVMLLDAGADPNRPGFSGRPAFFAALDKPDLLALLLPRGAHVDATDANGWTALMQATWDAQWPTVALLLAAGADVRHRAADGTGLEKATEFVRYRAGLEGKKVPPELLALEARLPGPGQRQ